ncbi:GntR family transcriptional regulator [Pseudonocardia spinosispora]|uniref:GntR family transcriptional regulator n=1 Tax=Pseudonocardia spinosispora TaxID=103441 RepID=UPI00056A0906|nr:GntR family transcriptional regulator [Pseudonocardia spinosispora]
MPTGGASGHDSGPASELAAARRRVVSQLRQLVIEGALQPGEKVVERAIAERFEVSRSPVREAVRTLIHEGFLVAESPRRIVVRRLSRKDVEELYEVREGIEMTATGLAALKATGNEVRSLHELLDEIAATTDEARLHRLNADFHVLLTQMAGNSLLSSIAHPLEGRLRWLYQQNSDWERLLAEHRAIADAVASGDEITARTLAVNHARSSRAHTLAVLFPDDAGERASAGS